VKWIFTHEDVDGVVSASLLKKIYRDSEVKFSNPYRILDDLKKNIELSDSVIILDIGLNESNWRELMDFLSVIKGEVTYVDHHPLPSGFKYSNIKFIHKEGVSTTELTYRFFKHELPREYSKLVLIGALGDYTRETDYSKSLFNYWDEGNIYLEVGLLSQGLEYSKGDHKFKGEVVNLLSEAVLPSEINELVNRAFEMNKLEKDIIKNVNSNIKTSGNISYVIDVTPYITKAAKYAYMLGDTPVGIAVKLIGDNADLSIRRRRDYAVIDLNSILREITLEFGGSGGGHPYAAGAMIPKGKIDNFILRLNDEISKVKIIV